MEPGLADRAVLLDLNPHVPIDVPVLDRTIATFYQRPNELEGKQAGETLTLLRDHKDAWEHYRQIIDKSSSQQTKYFALQILEEAVRFRWGALPAEKAMEIRDYVTNLIIGLSSNDTTFRQEKTFLNKLNIILVQIVKHVWPQRWENFIPELVGASKRSETLCENSMVILKLLSEEVFDFAKGEMTKAKTAKLKKSLNKEFTLILELCGFVLNASNKTDLIRATLVTLDAYLSWVPLGYIIHSNMIEALLKLFPQTEYRNVALQCLTEVAALTLEDEWNSHFVNMYNIFIQQLQVIVSNPAAIPAAYEQGTDEEQKFTQNLALFFTTFYKAHLNIVEKSSEQALLIGMDYLLNISFVSDDEIFKICLDYWNFFVPSIYSAVQISSGFSNGAFPGFGSSHVLENSRKRLYSQVLSRLRLLMITRMAKPEEVIVVEDENGNIVRETMKDTDTLARYKTMHETLVYLSHLDHEDTEEQMLSKLHLQSSGKEGSWQALNTLCWAIGSISGSMAEEQENRFLVTVIRDLLNLCEMTRGKDNKAVIAANIMYVVGQYPTFLRNHWKFLKTVVNKLFEFMHERHPGVQDMACETFLKICHTCKRKFVVQQMGETEPFISTLLRGLAETTNELEPHQVHMFYEAVGLMISSDSDPSRRNVWLDQLMGQANAIWQNIAENALPDNLKNTETMKHVLNILHKNVSVCTSLGTAFIPQMGKIFTSLLKLYRAYSELISTGINANGPHHAKTTLIKQMRSCKRVALKLLQTFVERCDDTRLLSQDMVPAMSNIILGDYALNVPDARESEVLALFAAIINRLKDKTEKDVPAIFEGIFDSTLGMITKNFEDYPEHRLNFFALLRVIINEVPTTLFQLAPHQLKVVIDAILWAIRHKERNIAELGLNTMLEMLSIVDKNEFATQFYQHFHGQFVSEIFHVMTDGLHKPGLKLQARILYHLISVVRLGVIKQPLWDVSSQGPNPPADNVTYVKQQMVILLMRNHSSMKRAEVEAFVQAMFASGNEASKFKQLLRDFLIVTKTIASEDNNNPLADNTNLLADEQAERLEATRLDPQRIPGMQNPHARQEEQMGD